MKGSIFLSYIRIRNGAEAPEPQIKVRNMSCIAFLISPHQEKLYIYVHEKTDIGLRGVCLYFGFLSLSRHICRNIHSSKVPPALYLLIRSNNANSVALFAAPITEFTHSGCGYRYFIITYFISP
jgi:hypothetical protein